MEKQNNVPKDEKLLELYGFLTSVLEIDTDPGSIYIIPDISSAGGYTSADLMYLDGDLREMVSEFNLTSIKLASDFINFINDNEEFLEKKTIDILHESRFRSITQNFYRFTNLSDAKTPEDQDLLSLYKEPTLINHCMDIVIKYFNV